MLILIAQKMRLGSLNATQKTIGLCQVPFLRKLKNKKRRTNLILFSSAYYLIWSLRGMFPVIPPITGDLVVTAAKIVSSSILDYICNSSFTKDTVSPKTQTRA